MLQGTGASGSVKRGAASGIRAVCGLVLAFLLAVISCEMAQAQAQAAGKMPGGVSRWNAQKDLSWEPLRIELVAEVRYEHVQSGRFRHGGRLVRFRPDRTPASCTFAQLDEVAPAELSAIFG